MKLQIILPNTPCIIYFWKADTKSSSTVMPNMSHVTQVTCHKYEVANNITKKPMYHIFWKADAKSSSMVMLKTSHVTFTCHQYEVAKNFTKYFWKADAKSSSMVMSKSDMSQAG